MSPEELEMTIKAGETEEVEFKRCGTVPGMDTFETICSFANRNGGSIFLGVADDGTVEGIGSESSLPVRRNIVNATNNPKLFSMPPVFEFEEIDCDGKLVIRIWVPAVQGIFRFKGKVYDRVADADIVLRTDAQISSLYLRKYNIYTEQHVFPHLELADLRRDLIERARQMAVSRRPEHPWRNMTDEELLRSAQLWGKNIETGSQGYNRACALIFGSDSTIMAACPPYKTDAIYREKDANRYDDRVVVRTNLIDAYFELSNFCKKHLPDPFALDGDQRVSARDIVVRELVSNSLIHREYTSPYPAKIVIDEEGMRTENASRALFDGRIRLADFNPMPKNPIIAGFFAQVGLAEELGSGYRNLMRWSRVLLGSDPVLEDGDVFKAFISRNAGPAVALSAKNLGLPKQDTLDAIWELLERTGESITVGEAARAADVSTKTARKYLAALSNAGLADAEGGKRVMSYRLARK